MAAVGETPYQQFSESDPREIRLVRLYPGTSKSPIKCELGHVSLSLGKEEERPARYLALSYCWGDASITKSILLNGESWPVTTNLLAFLRQFQLTLDLVCEALPDSSFLDQRCLQEIILLLPQNWHIWPGYRRREAVCSICSSLSDGRFWEPGELQDLRSHPQCFLALWIDAICINQADVMEKSRQIPLMGRIYQMATRVLVWLGGYSLHFDEPKAGRMDPLLERFSNVTDKFETQFPQTADIIDFVKEGKIATILGTTSASLRNSTRFLGDFCLHHQWFERIWVVQEVSVPSADPIVCLGNHRWSWQRLSTLCTVLLWHMMCTSSSTTEAMDTVLAALNKIHNLWNIRNNFQRTFSTVRAPDDDKAIAMRLHSLLINTDGDSFHSTNPVDHLYALLGMAVPVDSHIPEALRPDYNAPLAQVFHRFTAYTIKHSGNLSALTAVHFSPLPGSGYSWPSWVPDWRGDVVIRQQPSTTPSDIKFSDDGRELQVKGVRIGNAESRGLLSIKAARRRVEQNGGDPSRDPMDSLQEALDNMDQFVFANDMPHGEDLRLSELELDLSRIHDGSELLLLEEPRLAVSLNPSLKPAEAVVYMIRGAPSPSILVPVEGNKYRLFGGCYVARLDNPDEEYYAENVLEDLIIV